MASVMERMSLRNQNTVMNSVATSEAMATGVAPTRNCANVSPALLPMKIPTGLPSIVAEEPMFVAMTAMRTNGWGRSFSVSHTWNTSASTTTIDETSSTTDARTAERTQSIAVNETPFMFLRLMMDWMTHVRKPRSLRTPTIIIMPTRKKIMSSSVALRMDCSVIAWVAISTATPRNAAATRRSQKNSVVEITPAKTASVTACVKPLARPPNQPPRDTAAMTAARRRTLGLNFIAYSLNILLRNFGRRTTPTSLPPSRT